MFHTSKKIRLVINVISKKNPGLVGTETKTYKRRKKYTKLFYSRQVDTKQDKTLDWSTVDKTQEYSDFILLTWTY